MMNQALVEQPPSPGAAGLRFVPVIEDPERQHDHAKDYQCETEAPRRERGQATPDVRVADLVEELENGEPERDQR